MRSMKNQRIKSHIVWLAIISVTAILTSCGGDDPAKMEVINGISVPPEPDPVQNNATVAGVDVNSNGVRDDVERKIAEGAVKGVENEVLMEIARQYESLKMASTALEKKNALFRINCFFYKNSGDVSGSMYDLVFNSEERLNVYNNAYSDALDSGMSLVINDSTCQ